jgi:hypothetical protein
MVNYYKDMKRNIFLAFMLFFALLFLVIFFDFQDNINLLSRLFIWILTSIIFTGIIQIILQALTGRILEKSFLTIKIYKYRFPITIFLVVTIILRFYFF